jgi:hypothetical protein
MNCIPLTKYISKRGHKNAFDRRRMAVSSNWHWLTGAIDSVRRRQDGLYRVLRRFRRRQLDHREPNPCAIGHWGQRAVSPWTRARRATPMPEFFRSDHGAPWRQSGTIELVRKPKASAERAPEATWFVPLSVYSPSYAMTRRDLKLPSRRRAM